MPGGVEAAVETVKLSLSMIMPLAPRPRALQLGRREREPDVEQRRRALGRPGAGGRRAGPLQQGQGAAAGAAAAKSTRRAHNAVLLAKIKALSQPYKL